MLRKSLTPKVRKARWSKVRGAPCSQCWTRSRQRLEVGLVCRYCPSWASKRDPSRASWCATCCAPALAACPAVAPAVPKPALRLLRTPSAGSGGASGGAVRKALRGGGRISCSPAHVSRARPDAPPCVCHAHDAAGSDGINLTRAALLVVSWEGRFGAIGRKKHSSCAALPRA